MGTTGRGYFDISPIIGHAMFNDMFHITLTEKSDCPLAKTLARVAYWPIYKLTLNELKNKLLFNMTNVAHYKKDVWYVFRIDVEGMEPLAPLCHLPAGTLLRVNPTLDGKKFFLSVNHTKGVIQKYSHATIIKNKLGHLTLQDLRPGMSPILNHKLLSRQALKSFENKKHISKEEALRAGFKNAWRAQGH